VDVKVTLAACPACGGPLAETRVDCAYTTELAERPRTTVTQYRVWVCRGTVCGRRVRGQHPEVVPDQVGATAHRLEARVMAAAHVLHYGVGGPVRQVPAVLAVLTGMRLPQGAVTQDALRRAEGAIGTGYAQVHAAVPEAPVVHTDDTGGRVGGAPAYLMGFETDGAPVDQIRARHRHQEVQEVIPADYAGVMVTDRGRSCDAQSSDRVDQHKCLAHILRSISEVGERKRGRARDFGAQIKTVLQDALARWHTHRATLMADFKVEAEVLPTELTYQLRNRRLKDPDNQRLLNELGWHHNRGNVLRFLTDPRVPPTKNGAERALRPAVIARKVSHCSKNATRAHAFEAFTGVVRTLAKQGIDVLVENLSQWFQAPSIQGVPL
jgi:transposase